MPITVAPNLPVKNLLQFAQATGEMQAAQQQGLANQQLRNQLFAQDRADRRFQQSQLFNALQRAADTGNRFRLSQMQNAQRAQLQQQGHLNMLNRMQAQNQGYLNNLTELNDQRHLQSFQRMEAQYADEVSLGEYYFNNPDKFLNERGKIAREALRRRIENVRNDTYSSPRQKEIALAQIRLEYRKFADPGMRKMEQGPPVKGRDYDIDDAGNGWAWEYDSRGNRTGAKLLQAHHKDTGKLFMFGDQGFMQVPDGQMPAPGQSVWYRDFRGDLKRLDRGEKEQQNAQKSAGAVAKDRRNTATKLYNETMKNLVEYNLSAPEGERKTYQQMHQQAMVHAQSTAAQLHPPKNNNLNKDQDDGSGGAGDPNNNPNNNVPPNTPTQPRLTPSETTSRIYNELSGGIAGLWAPDPNNDQLVLDYARSPDKAAKLDAIDISKGVNREQARNLGLMKAPRKQRTAFVRKVKDYLDGSGRPMTMEQARIWAQNNPGRTARIIKVDSNGVPLERDPVTGKPKMTDITAKG